MKIEVKNLNLLFIYRNLKFKNIFFVSKNKDYKEIVNALNLKNKKRRIEYIYDSAIEYINKYYVDDLCKFVNNQCVAQRKNNGKEINGCCKKCHLVTDKGCPSVNLSCKLIYCKTALGNVKELKFSDIPILKCLSYSQRLVLKSSFFNTKESILKDLYYGLIYSTFRSLKSSIFLNKKKYI